MFSSYLNFLKFLHYLKNYECDENPYYEDITSVSQDKHGTSLVHCDDLMFNFEKYSK